MIERDNNIAVACKLLIGGEVTLIVAERAMRKDDERIFALGVFGVVEVRGNLSERAVAFEFVDSAFIHKDGACLIHLILACGRETVVVGEDERRNE